MVYLTRVVVFLQLVSALHGNRHGQARLIRKFEVISSTLNNNGRHDKRILCSQAKLEKLAMKKIWDRPVKLEFVSYSSDRNSKHFLQVSGRFLCCSRNYRNGEDLIQVISLYSKYFFLRNRVYHTSELLFIRIA